MALPIIEVEITADERQAVTAMDRAGDASRRLSRRISDTTARSRGFELGVRNAAFQVGDFAVQVGAGTDAMRAAALQIPQLLGGFGTLWAVLGTVAAIVLPLFSAMKGLNSEGRDMTEVFGTLQPVAQGLATALRSAATLALDFANIIVNNIDRILTIGATAAALFAGKWVAGFVAARVATFSLAAALATLKGALIRTGIGALIVGAGELVFQFTRLVKAAGGFGQAMIALKAVAVEAWERIEDVVHVAELRITAAAMRVGVAWREALAGITGADPGTDFAREAIGNLTDQADILSENLKRPFESISNIRDLLANMKEEGFDLNDIVFGGDDDEDGKKQKEKLDEQAKRIKEHFDRIKAIATGSLSDQLGGWSNYFDNLITLTGSSNDKLLRVAKTFKAAQALVDAWSAYNQVLADPTLPYFAKFAAGAQVLAAGIGAVNAIRSVSSGGGGAAAGAAGTAGATPAAPSPLEVRVSGLAPDDLISGAQVSSLFDRLQDEAGDRGLSVSFAR